MNNSKDGVSQSTGFIITSDGYAITSAHCVKNAISLEARRRVKDKRENTVETYHSCKIAIVDEVYDLAIIKLDNKLDTKFSFLPLSTTKNIRYLQNVITFGYPLGARTIDNITIQKGYISSSMKQNGCCNYLASLDANPGQSGSCVLDEDGKVIGVLKGYLLDPTTTDGRTLGLTEIVPSYYIFRLLKGDRNE